MKVLKRWRYIKNIMDMDMIKALFTVAGLYFPFCSKPRMLFVEANNYATFCFQKIRIICRSYSGPQGYNLLSFCSCREYQKTFWSCSGYQKTFCSCMEYQKTWDIQFFFLLHIYGLPLYIDKTMLCKMISEKSSILDTPKPPFISIV